MLSNAQALKWNSLFICHVVVCYFVYLGGVVAKLSVYNCMVLSISNSLPRNVLNLFNNIFIFISIMLYSKTCLGTNDTPGIIHHLGWGGGDCIVGLPAPVFFKMTVQSIYFDGHSADFLER